MAFLWVRLSNFVMTYWEFSEIHLSQENLPVMTYAKESEQF
jgi:hypothetical protein